MTEKKRIYGAYTMGDGR